MPNQKNENTSLFGGSALVLLSIIVLIGYTTFQKSSGAGPSNFGGTIVGTILISLGPLFTGLLAIVGLINSENPKWISVLALILSITVFLFRSAILS